MKNKKGEKISIIIPIYNIIDFIDRTISSVVGQTYENIEIIIVDDGSTDGSGKVCNDWLKKDGRIKYYYQDNAGVSNARNYAFSMCTGDYILFVDGDDEIASDMCEKLINKIVKDSADVSYCGFLNIFGDKTEERIPEDKVLENKEILHALITDVNFFTAIWNKLFKKSILLDEQNDFIKFKTGIYVGEDALWLSKVLKRANRVTAVPEPLYYWKRRANSATQGGSLLRTDEKYLTVLNAYREMIFEIDDVQIKKCICKRYLGISRECMIQAYKEYKYNLADVLQSKIKKDKKLYKGFDLFVIKLEICLLLIRMKAPIALIDKIHNA